MPWIPLAVAGAQLAGGMMGNAAAADEREASLKQMQEAVRYLESVGVPSVEAQKLVLEEYRSAGNLTPDMEQAFTQSSNAYDDIQLSPEYKEAGLEALGSLRDISDSGGMTLMDKSNMEKVLSDVGQADRGRREAAQFERIERARIAELEAMLAASRAREASSLVRASRDPTLAASSTISWISSGESRDSVKLVLSWNARRMRFELAVRNHTSGRAMKDRPRSTGAAIIE